MNPVDWLLKVIHESLIPTWVTQEEMARRLNELRVVSAGIADCIMKCPGAGCDYKLFIPNGHQDERHHICPECSTSLVHVTWKELATKALNDLERMKGKFGEGVAAIDDLKFQDACDKEELERLRELNRSPAAWMSAVMMRELSNNAHKGNWEDWKPDIGTLAAEILHHTGKLEWAVSKDNAFAVDEFAADIANFALKAAQLFGTAPKP